MVAEFGFGVLVVTFLLALYGVGAAIYGALKKSTAWVESARSAMLLTWPMVSLAALSIIILLVTNHYEVQYVFNVTSNSMPLYLKVTALWGGQAGSLVFWSWLMSAFASIAMLRKWDRDREFLPWVIVVALTTLAFFVGLVIFYENPFERVWMTTTGQQVVNMFKPIGASLVFSPDGRGLNPLLRHPGMVIHPPMLYLGFVSFVMPFAFGFAALVTGRTDDRWIRLTRRWTIVAWLFLSLGLVLGMRWAYDVLGWGGYWGWDPVEIAALMPWLPGTAFLHSVMSQEKRGMMKRWNMILIILTYSLVIFGTFLTRSGVLSSVHAFAQSAIGPAFFGFIAITFTISLFLLIYRWNDLRSEGEMKSLLSRESLFLFNNLLFMLILVVCFWGVIFPLISELIPPNQKVTFGPTWYKTLTGPLFAGLLILMGIAPLSAWGSSMANRLAKAIWKPTAVSLLVPIIVFATGTRGWIPLLAFWLAAFVACVTLYEYGRGILARHKTTGESLPVAFWRLGAKNRRRYGGYIIHLGVVLMALGVIGIEMFQTETQGLIKPGESLKLGDYTVTLGLKKPGEYTNPADLPLKIWDTTNGTNMNVARAEMAVYRKGQFLTMLYPRRDYYYESQQPMTIPGLLSNPEDDIYVILVDWQPITANGATFKVFHNPLVYWMWMGAMVFILGAAVAAWPDRDPEPHRVKVARPAPVYTEV